MGPPTTRAPHRRRAWWKAALDYLLVALMAIAVLVMGIVLYGTANNRWYKVIGVDGQSMSPTINRGDLIIITRPEGPEVGDIGVFQVDGKIVTHRIVGITPEGDYLTRGDANATVDDWSGAEVRLVGIYRARIPWIGRFFLDTRPGAP